MKAKVKVINNIRVGGFQKEARKDDIKCVGYWKRFSSVGITEWAGGGGDESRLVVADYIRESRLYQRKQTISEIFKPTDVS